MALLAPSGTSKIEPTIIVLQKRLDELHEMIMHESSGLAEPVRNECHFLLMDASKALVECDVEQSPPTPVPSEKVLSPRQTARQNAETTAKLKQAWKKFLSKCAKSMSPEEVSLLSLPTIKELMHYYQMDRDPVEMANVELYWRALAQQREDDRHAAALAHKKCSATTDETKRGPARQIAETMSPTRKR